MVLEINKVNSLEISSTDFWTSNTTTIEIFFPEIRGQSCFLKGPGEIYHDNEQQTNFIGIVPISNWPNPKYWNGITVELGEIEKVNLVSKNSDKYCDLKQINRHKTFQNIYNNLVLGTFDNREIDFQNPSILYICGGSSLNFSYILVYW